MNLARRLARVLTLAVILAAAPLTVAVADEADARAQFDAIMQGLDGNSFDRFNRAIDEDALTQRIVGTRLIDASVKTSFTRDFDASVNRMFAASFPESKSNILATVINFQMQGNQGLAIVRFSASGYRYSYHVYELALDQKGRLLIVDWIDYYQGSRFSEHAGAALVMAMPSKPATRKLLQMSDLPDREAFQASELFKAYRDNNGPRFFQIYDELAPELQREKVIARLHLQIAMQARDRARIAGALNNVLAAFPADALQSLRLVEFYIPARRYKDAIDALVLLEQALSVSDGAIGSLKAMAALADGNIEDAETYAKQATELEPGLEVAWWSLLRVRTRAEDYAGATAAMTRLEDDFGESLDPQTLGKDRFLKILADKPEYLAWRSSRD
jgi:tetratricopeptide (TPR) repeat protein